MCYDPSYCFLRPGVAVSRSLYAGWHRNGRDRRTKRDKRKCCGNPACLSRIGGHPLRTDATNSRSIRDLRHRSGAKVDWATIFPGKRNGVAAGERRVDSAPSAAGSGNLNGLPIRPTNDRAGWSGYHPCPSLRLGSATLSYLCPHEKRTAGSPRQPLFKPSSAQNRIVISTTARSLRSMPRPTLVSKPAPNCTVPLLMANPPLNSPQLLAPLASGRAMVT